MGRKAEPSNKQLFCHNQRPIHACSFAEITDVCNMSDQLNALTAEIAGCDLCADRFASTETGHEPRPVTWLSSQAPILIAGQAPGARVHASGIPFDDPSGDRLRDWLGIDRLAFYDREKFAVLPMAFCFPGYRKGADLPPPPLCAKTWRKRSLLAMPQIKLKLLIGGYAQKWHLGKQSSVTETVRNWREFIPEFLPLPHPSWRNTGWLKKHPWFEGDVIPWLRNRVGELLS